MTTEENKMEEALEPMPVYSEEFYQNLMKAIDVPDYGIEVIWYYGVFNGRHVFRPDTN